MSQGAAISYDETKDDAGQVARLGSKGGRLKDRAGGSPRLVARQRNEKPGILTVLPARTTERNVWTGYDSAGEPLGDYTTADLIEIQRRGLQLVQHGGTNGLEWSPNHERVFSHQGRSRGASSSGVTAEGKRRRSRRRRGLGPRSQQGAVFLNLADALRAQTAKAAADQFAADKARVEKLARTAQVRADRQAERERVSNKGRGGIIARTKVGVRD